MILGVIADDVTGATDVASVLIRAGCRVVQTFGIPGSVPPETDAIVVSTKIRMAPVEEALATVDAALDFLRGQGADQIFYKYCSTFDSTARGNIGPVIDHLLARLGADATVACPSYPALARTVYQGHLFVGDRLLSESSMRDHPLTPMRDSDLVRVLGVQGRATVGLAPLSVVTAGAGALRDHIAALGRQVAIVDAIDDDHVATIARACATMPLVTGGAALGGALGAVRIGGAGMAAPARQDVAGPAVMLSGSCSAMTLAQVAHMAGQVPMRAIDPLAADGDAIVDWALDQAARGDVLIYSSADPQAVGQAQAALGREEAAARIEALFARLAARLAQAGVRRFIVAGGETSGAVTRALGVRMMSFGPEIAPGVPVTYTQEPRGYALALKSGNFGEPDFFQRAREMV
jgi:3-dehydrotetronate 4-kinase